MLIEKAFYKTSGTASCVMDVSKLTDAGVSTKHSCKIDEKGQRLFSKICWLFAEFPEIANN